MKPFVFRRSLGLKGKISLPGDKSIGHRAVILSSLACGKTTVYNLPLNEDCLATINSFKALGVRFKSSRSSVIIFGNGFQGLVEPKLPIFIKESGTTFRLLLGVLFGLGLKAKLVAGPALSKRPFSRVIKPLRLMGANIVAKVENDQERPPFNILKSDLKSISYRLPVASAQVKSAILLAGLFAKGVTRVIEPLKTRDHTERMLKLFKANIKINANSISIKSGKDLVSPGTLYIPGDLSSAAFFIVGASIIPNSKLLIKNVSLNPGRIGALKVLRRMQANIKVQKITKNLKGNEPMGDLFIKSAKLTGTRINKNEVPSLIDELPILMVAACLAKGKTVFEGVGELRLKETDRIRSMAEGLKKMGAKIKVSRTGRKENIIIDGVKELKAAKVKSFGDHRSAMSLIIAGLAASGNSRIDDVTCINKSFPEFLSILSKLT